MQGVLQGVRLEELGARRGLKQQSLATVADELPQPIREFLAQVHCPDPVLRFEARLDDYPVRFLLYAESTEVLGDVLANFKTKRFSGPQRTAASEERVEQSILTLGISEDICKPLRCRRRLMLVFDNRRIDVFFIPLPREELFPVFVDRRGHHALDDVHVVADRSRRELRRHCLDQFFYSAIADVGQKPAFEEW